MSDKWKNREKPNANHLFNLPSEDHSATILRGHLIVEAILVQLIDIKMAHPEAFDSFKLSFPQKVSLAIALGLIDNQIGDYLNEINSLRNKFAHRLGFTLSFDDSFDLAKRAGQAGIDFSDEGIYSDKKWSAEYYGIDGILEEVFRNTAVDLDGVLESFGGTLQLV